MPITYNPTDSRFLAVAQARTNNGQKDVRIILDIQTNEFYSLDDDGNFNLIGGGGGSQSLADVLNQGNSTGNNTIMSPDTLTQFGILDGQGYLTCNDLSNYGSFITMLPSQITSHVTNTVSNDFCSYNLASLGGAIASTFNSGLSTNTIIASNGSAGLEHFTVPSQSQRIFVDSSTANMKYEDGINIIDVELGLTNGFRARQTTTTPDFENYIQVKFDKVQLVFDDNTNQFELKVDTDGYSFKNLPAFDDDTDAAGLPQGCLYQTTGIGAAPLNVAGIVMIKQ